MTSFRTRDVSIFCGSFRAVTDVTKAYVTGRMG